MVYNTIANLMIRRKFDQITVFELCEAAQISRATFYVHFEDKYDLLRAWLTNLIKDAYSNAKDVTCEQREEYFNELIYENKNILENLLIDAYNETLEIIFGVIISFSNMSTGNTSKTNPEYVVLSNIYVGGLISYMRWYAKNKFPKEPKVLNEYLYDAVKDYFSNYLEGNDII